MKNKGKKWEVRQTKRERENERKGGAEQKREGGNNESDTLRDTIAPQI